MANERFYLGLAATLHDPALAIVDGDGRVVFAEAAERYLQDKRAYNCPPDHMIRAAELVREHCGEDAELVAALTWSGALATRLRLAGLAELPVLRSVAKPLLERGLRRKDPLIWPMPRFASLLRAMTASVGQAGVNLAWRGALASPPRGQEHHLCHAAYACGSSPFEDAACAVVDGFGEWTSTSCFRYRGGRLEPLGRAGARGSGRRGSLGMFYAMLCALCGFDPVKGEEWKVMGLAPYGTVDDELRARLGALVRVEGLEVVRGVSPGEYRRTIDDLRARAPDPAVLARSGQEVFAERMRELLANLHERTGCDELVLTGGCALNSSWNGRVTAETPFRRLFVPSAPADDGCAVGAALLAWSADHPGRAPRCAPLSPYLGSAISSDALGKLLRFGGWPRLRRLPGAIAAATAELLAAGKIVGWMQGRAEFGPRALGHRSILADPRAADMKDRINERVKFREEFRPFAPAILHEHGDAWFESYQESPYMERTLAFRPAVRERVPAVVHVDGTGRLQSVTDRWSPRFHEVLSEFHARTGVPLLLNTSFNVMGRPIVHAVEDAVAAFLTTGLDALVIDDVLFEKESPHP